MNKEMLSKIGLGLLGVLVISLIIVLALIFLNGLVQVSIFALSLNTLGMFSVFSVLLTSILYFAKEFNLL